MKSIFIMYMPGHAGTFLSRLMSLSPETVQMVPKNIMNHYLKNQVQLSEKPLPSRLECYLFSKAASFENWQEFHSAWSHFVEQCDNKIFDRWIKVCGVDCSKILYEIHPHEFMLYKKNIDEIEEKLFYYVDLDLSKYHSWVESARKQLGFVDRPDEYKKFVQYRNDYNMLPINLTRMLESTSEFVNEYLQLTQSMEITPDTENATTLFLDWKKARGIDVN